MVDTIEGADYRDLSKLGEPHVHPDGDRVAIVLTEPIDDEEYQSSIHLVELADGETRQYTVAEGMDSQPRFSPSGDRLAFVSTRGGDDSRPQLWVLPTTGGEARQVTDVVGSVSDVSWSPDGSRIAFSQSVTKADREEGRDRSVPDEFKPAPPDPRVIDRTIYRTIGGYRDGRHSHVYVVDLAAEEDPVKPVTEWEDRRGFRRPEWGDATTLYYTTTPTDVPDPDDTLAFELVSYDVESDTAESLVRSSGFSYPLAATQDGRIAYSYLPDERGNLQQADLHVYDARTDTVHVPTASLDRTVGGFTTWGATWGPDEEYLYFTTPDEGSLLVRRVRWDGSEPPEVVTANEGRVLEFSVADDVLVSVASTPDHPEELFVSPLDNQTASEADGVATGHEDRRLTAVNADYLAGRAVAEPEEVWFDGPDGHRIQGWLLLPPEAARSDEQEQFPLVTQIHGGPHAGWTIAGGWWWHEFQVMAARGYAVFWANPRGSTGYGQAVMAANEGNWGRATLADLEAGLDVVTEYEEIDETQLFVTGYSFGGYMTGWSVGNTDRFEAAVSEAGIYDLASYYGSADAYRGIERSFGATPWEGAEVLQEHSPATYADEIETPTLVLHSEEDFRTPINTAELFYRSLRKNGVDTRLVRYPREGHSMIRRGEPQHVIDRLERILRWFDGYCEYADAQPALVRDPHEGLSTGEGSDGDVEGADDDAATSG